MIHFQRSLQNRINVNVCSIFLLDHIGWSSALESAARQEQTASKRLVKKPIMRPTEEKMYSTVINSLSMFGHSSTTCQLDNTPSPSNSSFSILCQDLSMKLALNRMVTTRLLSSIKLRLLSMVDRIKCSKTSKNLQLESPSRTLFKHNMVKNSSR